MKPNIKNVFVLLFVLFFTSHIEGQVTIPVTNTNTSGAGSLYEAIKKANTDGVDSEIQFYIPNSGSTPIIRLTESLYTLGCEGWDNKRLIINGATAPIYGMVIIENAVPTNRTWTGLSIISNNVEVYGLHFRYFGTGIGFESGGCVYFDGTEDPPSPESLLASGIKIGKAAVGSINYGNLFTSNIYGIKLESQYTDIANVEIKNNIFGTERTYTSNLGNSTGIYINISGSAILSNVLIGGNRALGEGNVFAYTPYDAIYTNKSVTVNGNYIGTDPTQTKKMGNRNGFADYYSNVTQYFENNIIANNTQFGITAYGVNLVNNSFFCNATPLSVKLTATLPTITKSEAQLVQGTGAVGELIYLYYNDNSTCSTAPCQGRTLINGTAITVPAGGVWSYIPATPLSIGRTITAQAKTNAGVCCSRTSIFSTCATIICPTGRTYTLSNRADVSCYGGTDGRVTVTMAPASTYTYSWTTGGPSYGTGTRTDLAAGSYTWTATDGATGCGYIPTTPTVINQPTAVLDITCSVLQHLTTITSNDGRAQIVVTGGTPPYTLSYSRNGGAAIVVGVITNSYVLSSLAAGTYILTVTDSKYNATSITTNRAGCTDICTFTINPPVCTSLSATLSLQKAVSCAGNSDGVLKVKFSEPTSLPLAIRWSDNRVDSIRTIPPDSILRTGLAAGTYAIVVTNKAQCSVTSSAKVTQPDTLSIVCDSVQASLKVGQALGSAWVSVKGGTLNYTLKISQGPTPKADIVVAAYSSVQITGLKKGRYLATLIDKNNCQDTCWFNIEDPICKLRSEYTSTNVSCFGGNNGSIELKPDITTGTAPFSYRWGDNSTANATRTNLAVGNYFFTVTDDQLCTISDTVAILQPNKLIITCLPSDTTRTAGSSTGQGKLHFEGGTTAYKVLIYSVPNNTLVFQKTEILNDSVHTGRILLAGDYRAVLTDINGCTDNCLFTVYEPKCTATLTTSPTNVLCNGQANGGACATMTGGISPLKYQWSNGATTACLTNIIAGTYAVTVTDSIGCIKTTTVTVTEPTVLTVNTSSSNITRVGTNNGTITLTASGGTPAYTVRMALNGGIILPTSLDPPQYNFTNLASGTYQFTVTDSKGCTKTGSVVITEPTCRLALPAAAVNSVSCNGDNNGRITVNPTGGNGVLTYTWNPTQIGNSNSLTNLTAGLYRLTVTDTSGCTVRDSIRVLEPAALSSTPTATNVTTIGGNDGSINITIRGGTIPYTVVRTPSVNATRLTDSTFVFNALAKGTYLYTVTDSKGCTTSATATVSDPTCTLEIVSTITHVTCNGQSNGGVCITRIGGTAPISYLWSNAATTACLTNVAAGTYTVTVTDAQGCIKTTTATITEPTVLAVNISSTNITRVGVNNGTITLTASGGTPTYTVSMTLNGGAISPTSQAPPQYNFTNLASGTYLFTVTDSKGCTKTGSVVITEPTCRLALPAATVTAVSCNGGLNGGITVNPIGGNGALTYTWSPAQTGNPSNLTNLVAGLYRLTVTDTSGCTARDSMRVLEPLRLSSTPTVTNVTTIGGSNGSINIVIRGGTIPYTVTRGIPPVNATRLTDTTFVFNTLSKGTYTYTVTDSKGCTTSATVTVTEPTCTLEITPTLTHVTCNGLSNGGVCITPTGGTAPIKYIWSNEAITACLTNIAAGTYTVTATDSVGCVKTATAIVTQPAVLAVSVSSTNITRVGTNNGTITLVASGGTPTYALNMTLNGSAISPTSQASPQYNYTNLALGTYLFTVTDSKGCTKTGSVVITEPTCRLALPAATVTSVSCNGGNNGSITVNPTGGNGALTYTWNPAQTGNPNSLTNLTAGLYRLTVTDTSGCTVRDSMRILEPLRLSSTPTVTNVTTIGGSNGSINIVIRGGTIPYTVTRGIPPVNATRLTDTTFVFNTLSKGTYTYTVTDSKGCTASATVTVSDPTCTLEIASIITNVTCNGLSNGGVCMTPTGGTAPISYVWSNGATTACLTNVAAGTYTVTATDSQACIKTATVTITQPAVLAVNVISTNITRVGVNNGTITLIASGGTPTYALNMTLNGGAISPTSQAPPQYNFTNLASGTYLFTFTDAKGCTKTGAVVITEPPCRLVLPAATVVSVSCNGGNNGSITVSPTGGNGVFTYTWSPAQTGNINNITNLTAGLYRLTVTDTSGCTARDSMRVLEPASLTTTPTTTSVSTIGGNNGSINIIIRGGTSPYTVVRGAPSVNATRLTDSTFVFNTLTKGTYTYTVTDSKGCTRSATVTVNDPACGTLTLTPSVTDVNCKGDATGRIVITPTGGRLPYTFVWNPTSLGTTNTASNLRAGSYIVSVTDAEGCSQSQTMTVAEPTLALSATGVATAITTTTATDGTITVTVSGGTQPYIVRSGTLVATTQTTTSFIFNGLANRDYTFTVTDAKGCTATGTATVGSPNCNLSVEAQVNAVKCNGESTGSIILTPSNNTGNVTYVWIPNTLGTGSSAVNLRAGVYTFTATDGRNCSQSRTITVTEPPKLDSGPSKKDVGAVGSSDGTISVVALGGTPPYTITLGTTAGTAIRPDSFVFTGLTRGNYTYILKDANGCTASQTVAVNDPSCSNVSAVLTEAQKITCFGGSDGRLNLAVANFEGPQYSWNPSSIGNVQNPTGLKAGVYAVTVSDSRGCSATAQLTLTEPAQIKATLAGGARICRGDSATLRFTVENATNFVLTYTSGGQNFTTTSLQTFVKPQLNAAYTLVSVVSGTCSGTVSTNIVNVEVTVPSGIATIRSLKDSLCQGDTLVLIPSINGNQYVWHRPNQSDTTTTGSGNLIITNANATHSGNYTLQALQSGCLTPNSEPKRITVFPRPTERASAGVDKSICEGSVTTLSASIFTTQNVTGRWLSLNNAVTVAQPSSFTTNVTNLVVGNNTFVWVLSSAFCGEFSRDSVVVAVSGKPDLAAAPTVNMDSKLTSALINTRELLKNKSLDPSLFIIQNLKFPDKTKVTVQNGSIHFDRNDLLDAQTVDIEFEICSIVCPTVCNKGKITFVLEQFVDNTDFTVPKLLVINNGGSASLNIDGLEFFTGSEVTVVNRWGSIVFGPTVYKNGTPDKAWDGQKNGKQLPPGAYYYYIKYTDKDVLKVKKGIIYLVEE